MKKLLISILTILGIGLSFCSANWSGYKLNWGYVRTVPGYNAIPMNGNNCLMPYEFQGSNFEILDSSGGNVIGEYVDDYTVYCSPDDEYFYIKSNVTSNWNLDGRYMNLSLIGGGSCPEQLIDVEYNSGNTSTITCDGINYISIKGLSTITNSNGNYEYTPYFNITYRDEDNQLITESYDKINLYLSGALFKKTYTDDNEWILTVQGNSDSDFNGYLPTFDVTGTIDSPNTGNIFNNFAENSLKFTLSNIPSYIQYVIIIMLLFFILGFIRKFKRK